MGGWTERQRVCLTGSLTNELSAYLLVNLSVSQSLMCTVSTRRRSQGGMVSILTGPKFRQWWSWFAAWARDFFVLQNAQTGSGVHAASYSAGTLPNLCWGWSGQSVNVTMCLLLVLRLRMSGTVLPILQYAFTVCTGTTLHLSLHLHPSYD
jgi:hypothetical protein